MVEVNSCSVGPVAELVTVPVPPSVENERARAVDDVDSAFVIDADELLSTSDPMPIEFWKLPIVVVRLSEPAPASVPTFPLNVPPMTARVSVAAAVIVPVFVIDVDAASVQVTFAFTFIVPLLVAPPLFCTMTNG